MGNCVITIARGYGSGGKQIGKLLAKKLGIDCYDREILRMASDDSGISEELFGKADESSKPGLLKKITSRVYKGEILGPDSDDFTSNENLFNCQAKVIKELAENESCVIIGRCADFILKDNPDAISVFFHSSFDTSFKNVKEVQGLEDEDIKPMIEKRDRYRADYYKYHTGNEWCDARNYDLCISTDGRTFEECVNIVIEYMKIAGKEI